MKTFKDAMIILLAVIGVMLFIADIFFAFHSIYHAFTHIHLTKMEALFDPENHMGVKLLALGATYADFKILIAISDKN